MDLDQTQALDGVLGEYGSDNEDIDKSPSKKVVAHLKVFSHLDFLETIFPIYEGENDIGRGENCSIVIPMKALSKKHAVIEVVGGLHLIHDCQSKNRTRKEKVFLRPKIRYELKYGDMLTLADVRCQYLISSSTKKSTAEHELSDTASETGSESMLPISQDEESDTCKEKTELAEEKVDVQRNGNASAIHRSVQKLQEEMYVADTEDETDDDDDGKVPIFTPGRQPIKESDDEPEEKTFDEKNNNLHADRMKPEGAVDNERGADEKPELKLIFESDSDADVSQFNKGFPPQPSGHDDSTDDEEFPVPSIGKETLSSKPQVGGAGDTLAFGLVTPEYVMMHSDSEKTQTVEATLPVSQDSHERRSSQTVFSSENQKFSDAKCAMTLMYDSDKESTMPSANDDENIPKDSLLQCPATLIYRSEEEEEDHRGGKPAEDNQSLMTDKQIACDCDEEFSKTVEAEHLEKQGLEEVDLCGPTLLYTSGEEIPTSPTSEEENQTGGANKVLSSPEKVGSAKDDEGNSKHAEAVKEPKIDEKVVMAARSGSENTGLEENAGLDQDATQVYNLDDDDTDDEGLLMAATQSYDSLTSKPAVTKEEAVLDYGVGAQTHQCLSVNDEGSKNKESHAQDLQQTLVYGTQGIEATQAYEAGKDLQTLGYGIDRIQESSGEEACEATQAYGLDCPDSPLDKQSKPSTSGITFEVETEIVPDSQDVPVVPVVQEKEEHRGRRVTFAEVSETDENEMDLSKEPIRIHSEKEMVEDSEEDVIRPRGRKANKTVTFLDSQEFDVGNKEKESIIEREDLSVSNERPDVSTAAVEDHVVDPHVLLIGPRRISKRGTKKPFVEIISAAEPEKGKGRRRSNKSKEEEAGAEPSSSAGARSRRGKQQNSAELFSLPEEAKKSTPRPKRDQGKRSQIAGGESSDSLSVQEEELVSECVEESSVFISKKGRSGRFGAGASEAAIDENVTNNTSETLNVSEKKVKGRKSRAATSKTASDENSPGDTSENLVANDKKGKGRKSTAAVSKTAKDENTSDDTPETLVANEKKTRGRKSRAATSETVKDESTLGNTPETVVSNNKKSKGTTSRAVTSEKATDKNTPDDTPEVLVANNKKGRGRKSRASASETTINENTPENTPDTLVANEKKIRGRKSRGSASVTATDENVSGDTPEILVSRNNKSGGTKSRSVTSEKATNENAPGDTPEVLVASNKKGRGRKSRASASEAVVHENTPNDTPETLITNEKNIRGRKSRGAELTEYNNTPCKMLETSVTKGKSKGRQTKDEKPTGGVQEPAVLGSKIGQRKQSEITDSNGDEKSQPEASEKRSRVRGKQPRKSMANEVSEGSSVVELNSQKLRDIDVRRNELSDEKNIDFTVEGSLLADEVTTSTNSVSAHEIEKHKGKHGKASLPCTSRAVLEQIPTDEDAEDEPLEADSPSIGSRRRKESNKKSKEKTPDSSQTLSLLDSGSQSNMDSPESVSRKGRGKKKQIDKSSDQQALATPSKRGRKKSLPIAVDSSTLHQQNSNEDKPRVMFTGLLDKRREKIVTNLGGELVDSIYNCTHLVTDKVRRTVKFLCGVASGQMIVLPAWLDACGKAKAFVDSKSYFVKDKDAEKQYKFLLERSHERALEKGLLEGYKVHVTPQVKPDAQQMKDIIQCAKGEFLPRVPRQAEENLLVISCEEDIHAYQPCLNAGIPVYTAELLLTGILRQELDLQEYRLFTKDGKANEANTSEAKKRGRDSVNGSSVSSASRGSKRRKR